MKSRVISILAALAIALFALAGAPSRARAQSSGCDEENEVRDDAGAFRKVVRGGEVVYEYTGEIRVCGKVPRPNVVAILLEKTIGYEWEKLKKDFIPKIKNAVRKAPF